MMNFFQRTVFLVAVVALISNLVSDPTQCWELPEGSIAKNDAPSSISAQSKFDIISHETFQKAVATNMSNSPRKPFVLDSNWEREGGGLDDADRQTIGDLYYKASSVFEFGLGESTRIAAATQVPRYAGVDSDPAWVGMARGISIELKMDHFRFYLSDIGPTVRWGYPVNRTLTKISYNYIVSALMAEQEAFDVYLVDGRMRVACACASFLHAIKHGGNLGVVRVAIHDNHKKNYRGYGVFEQVADVEIRNTKLWVYKLKTDLPDIEQKLYDLLKTVINHLKR